MSPNIIVRIFLVHCTSAAFMVACLYSFVSLNKKQRTVGGTLFCAICTLILLFNLFRIFTAVFFEQANGLFDVALTNFLNPLFGFIIPYGLTLSIFLLCNERQLLAIKALERKANEDAQVKQRYLATLSHELRTPLNGMIGKAQLMRPQLTSEQLKQDCDVIIDAGQALSQLTNDVLEFTLLEQENLTPVNTELTPYLQNIIELLKPLAIQKNIKLTLTANIDFNVLIEPNKIRQVLINLLGNAIKFTYQGEVNLTIHVEKEIKNTAILTFIIKDTGIGISQEKSKPSPLLKTPNTQQNIHEYDNQKGYGLGLSLCEQLLKSMDSHLDYSSTKNEGSTFYFSIKSQISPVSPTSKISLTNKIETTNPVPPLNVLLVEDIKLNQDIAKAMLEKDLT
ncbi:ATP-binding protein [Colwellia sp. MSW7]|uniref:histidine kinase n=1 Tax=Colwellia maritima TaxID=2912588 RepID=A0ABS9X8P2_9GAMM|nr:ATP-binding protein [Colwellia maritima]MCI2285851.1 ATP-binding protein [Colwellia maritima]